MIAISKYTHFQRFLILDERYVPDVASTPIMKHYYVFDFAKLSFNDETYFSWLRRHRSPYQCDGEEWIGGVIGA